MMAFDAHFHADGRKHTGLCNAAAPEDWQQTIDYCVRTESAVPFLGIHPWYGDVGLNAVEQLRSVVQQHRCGIGEIGLDAVRGPGLAQQLDLLELQLEIADALERPVALHCVRVWGDLMKAIRSLNIARTPCMIHGYSGSHELARQLLDLGVHLSFGPRLLDRRNAKLRHAFVETPLHRILLETDAPHSQIGIETVYVVAAEIRSMEVDALIQHVEENARKFVERLPDLPAPDAPPGGE